MKDLFQLTRRKKKESLELLHLIDKQFHTFYKNFKVADVPDTDPDLIEVDPDEH